MDNTAPIPKPRTHNASQKSVFDNDGISSKKPIPLPRTTKTNCNTSANNNLDTVSDEIISPDVNTKTHNERRSFRSMREEWKMSLEDAQSKGKYLMDNTKQVGSRLEKSVRNMLGRRLTVRSSPERSENHNLKVNRSVSLPAEDIFNSISFPSPLNVGNVTQEIPVVYEDAIRNDCKATVGAPPPVYPPPPLPDESLYDEIGQNSAVSSQSSNCDTYSEQGSDTIYEDVLIARNVKLHNSLLSDSPVSDYPFVNDDRITSGSESWCYISGAGNQNEIYQNLSAAGSSDSDGNDLLLVSRIDVEENVKTKNIKEMLKEERSNNSQSHFSDVSSLSVRNDLYENWEIPASNNSLSKQMDIGRNVLTKSVILEFDPLFENSHENDGADCSFLQFMLHEDSTSPYGKIKKLVKEDESENRSIETEYLPVPPERCDSLNFQTESIERSRDNSLERSSDNSVERSSDNSLERSDDITSDGPVISREPAQNVTGTNSGSIERNRKTSLVRWTSMKRAFQSMTDRRISKEPKEFIAVNTQKSVFYEDRPKCGSSDSVKRPNLVPHLPVRYSGTLYRCDRLRNFVQRYCVLSDGHLKCFSDKSGSAINDELPLDKVLCIQLLRGHKVGANGEDLHLFELNLSWKGCYYLFGVTGSSERQVWMQKILESLTSKFPVRILTDYTRAGWSFIKEGISGVWTSGWIVVHKRTLVYYVEDGNVVESDLRKARCTVLQHSKNETATLSVTEKGPLILVDFPGQSLYLQMDTIKETMGWHHVIRSAAVDNGLSLDQQQLTREDIPTIIDKCINFVYAHGSMSEGIYRRSGANSSVTKLLTQFRQDAWSVQLTRQDYTEYDISSVLKRFLRDLPEPLLTTELHSQLCEIAAGICGPDRVRHYQNVLEQLPQINYNTTRKLIGHLHFIHQQQEKNLMPVENLAAIWGPTLMHVEGGDNLNWSKLESRVVSDLILLYSKIYEVDDAEIQREKQMQEVLERYHAANTSVPQNKPSGDLKIWVYLQNRNSSNCINVTIGPQKLAREVCAELSGKMGQPAHELCLEEVVCCGALTRPLHHMERVLDVVLRWGYWDDVDRKENCLVLCPNTVFREAAVQAKFPMALCGELRFADCKSRSFKTYLFEFSQAKLCYYKDKRGSVKLNEWKIEDIIWYLGYEPKRNPQMRWAITFIDRHNRSKRSKESPYFGYTIAGINKEEQNRWIGAMLAAEHPKHLLPSPELLQ